MIGPKLQQCLAAFDNRPMVDNTCNGGRVAADATGNIFNAAARPPPRMPKGRVVGPVLPYEGSRDIKDVYDPRVMVRNGVAPPASLSPHYVYRSKGGNEGSDSLMKKQHSPGMTNINPYYKQVGHGEEGKYMTAQSQYGVAGAAAVAVAAHREVGVVQMGLLS